MLRRWCSTGLVFLLCASQAHAASTLEQAAHFVLHPWVIVALLVAGCALLFHDLLTPLTWGVTGTLGVLCLGLVFVASVVVQNACWLGVLLMLGGLALLLAETHLYPGRGLPAVFGFGLLFTGMFEVLTIVKTPAFALSVSSFLTLITVIAFFAYLPKSPVWKQIGRDLRQRSQPTLSFYMENPEHLLGRAGITQTPLRPFGVVEIDGQPVEVLTEGDFLEPGVPVFVTQVEGSRIVVEPKSPVGIG